MTDMIITTTLAAMLSLSFFLGCLSLKASLDVIQNQNKLIILMLENQRKEKWLDDIDLSRVAHPVREALQRGSLKP